MKNLSAVIMIMGLAAGTAEGKSSFERAIFDNPEEGYSYVFHVAPGDSYSCTYRISSTADQIEQMGYKGASAGKCPEKNGLDASIIKVCEYEFSQRPVQKNEYDWYVDQTVVYESGKVKENNEDKTVKITPGRAEDVCNGISPL